MSRWDEKIGGVGDDGCMCAINFQDCLVHYPEPAKKRHAAMVKRFKRSMASIKGWQTRRRNKTRRKKVSR